MSATRVLTSSRAGRLSLLGRLAGGLAVGALGEGMRRLADGQRPAVGDLLLTPANMNKVALKLSELRGAAMKIGQLISMDSGYILSRELSDQLSRLQADAHQMPLLQVAKILSQSWGSGWESSFSHFSFTAQAAASIGQVHRATLRDGTKLAVKIQYPGVRESIDSDVDGAAAVLRVSGLLPASTDLDRLLLEAKRQLHLETDYEREGQAIEQTAKLLAGDDRLQLPALQRELSGSDVLVMSYLDGEPVEKAADLDRDERNRVGALMLELALRELFEWGWVQTDPNPANYLYSREKRVLQLLDFGAYRHYSAERVTGLRALLEATGSADDETLLQKAVAVGYLAADDDEYYRRSIISLLRAAMEPLQHTGLYDFAGSDLPLRMRDMLVDLRMRKKFGTLPPADILFLHRKLAGLFLLLAKLRVELPVAELAEQALAADKPV